MHREDILHVRLDRPPFSAHFRRQSGEMGLHTIGDVVMLKPESLRILPGFNYTWLAELGNYLVAQESSELLHR
jgi:hypothetical protein